MIIRPDDRAHRDARTDRARPAVDDAGTIGTPGLLRMLRVFAKRVFQPGAFFRPPDQRRDSVILDAAVFIRMGYLQRAHDALSSHDRVLSSDPAYLNLLGVINEARNQRSIARRFYGIAICSDPSFMPAQLNMRRMYELDTFGHTQVTVSLGDVELRSHRALSPVA
jgi:hypothetical protein